MRHACTVWKADIALGFPWVMQCYECPDPLFCDTWETALDWAIKHNRIFNEIMKTESE
jgi:hypothetical protein